MVWKAAVVALLLASPANGEDQIEAYWAKYGKGLTKLDISKEVANLAMLIVEGQYYISYCEPHMAPGAVSEAREWFRREIVESPAAYFRALTDGGNQSYYQGYEDRRRDSPSAELCQRTIADWEADFNEALDAAHDPTGALVK